MFRSTTGEGFHINSAEITMQNQQGSHLANQTLVVRREDRKRRKG